MEKSDAILIMKCVNDLNNNRLNTQLINDAYSKLPDVQPDTFQRVKVQAIQRFTMFNMDKINEALNRTVVVVEQSPIGEKVGKTTTRPKTKTKSKVKK